ncbi:MAG: hypothetical protein I8H72_02775 [Myxococcaceae bacterium]|nr:hypothetical protein [Myxococcaceae bacterium]
MIAPAMTDLPFPDLHGLILLLSFLVTLVKSSLYSVAFILLIMPLVGQPLLIFPAAFLLGVSWLIPDDPQRFRKRRFRLGKFLRALTLLFAAWEMRHLDFASTSLPTYSVPSFSNLTWILPVAILATFTVAFLFSRHHVR